MIGFYSEFMRVSDFADDVQRSTPHWRLLTEGDAVHVARQVAEAEARSPTAGDVHSIARRYEALWPAALRVLQQRAQNIESAAARNAAQAAFLAAIEGAAEALDHIRAGATCPYSGQDAGWNVHMDARPQMYGGATCKVVHLGIWVDLHKAGRLLTIEADFESGVVRTRCGEERTFACVDEGIRAIVALAKAATGVKWAPMWADKIGRMAFDALRQRHQHTPLKFA